MKVSALFIALGMATLTWTNGPAALGQTTLPRPLVPSGSPPAFAPMGTYAYTAHTSGPVRRVGAVTAGGITWQCTQNTCSVGGPWPTPGVGSCAALAREVGVIVFYGHASAQLNAAQLAQCNAGISVVSAALAPADPGITVTTPELSAVGGEVIARAPDIPPIAVTTEEVSAVGGAVTTAPPDIPPIAVTTPEVSAVGRKET